MFTDVDFWYSLWVSLSYAAATTIPQMLIGLGIALLLSRENWFTRILKVVLVFPLMIAPVIATLIWQLMTNTSVGILEKFLNLFGVYGFPWAASSKTALFTAALIDIWVYAPFVIVLVSAGIQSLPKSPFEAAKVDGGSAWFTFKTLTLPMLKPFLYIALIFRLMAALTGICDHFRTHQGRTGKYPDEPIYQRVHHGIPVHEVRPVSHLRTGTVADHLRNQSETRRQISSYSEAGCRH